jgi:K+ transport systems, NAD-binding component
MNILVIGCGKLGRRLADSLFRYGHTVSVVDRDPDSFKELDDDFDGLTVTGIPMDIEVMKSAGVESCDAVAAVTEDDNLNITISQIVKEFFGINNVVTRVIDPSREQIFNEFGLKTVCETKLSCAAMLAALEDSPREKQATFGSSTLSFFTREIEAIFIGRKINELPNRKGETIIGTLDKNGHVSIDDEQVVSSKDKVIYTRVVD